MENNEQTNPEETHPLEQHDEQHEHLYADGQAIAPLTITEDIRSYLYETAKWTKFLSIIGFIFTAIMVLFTFGIGAFITALSKLSPANPMLAMGSGFLTVYCLLIALLYFYPSLLMFKHSNAAKKAVLYGDQLSLSAAMSSMKSFFKFWGILMIIMIALYVIIFIMAIIGGIAAASAGLGG